MNVKVLDFTLSNPDTLATAAAILKSGVLPPGIPSRVNVRHGEVERTSDLLVVAKNNKNECTARWLTDDRRPWGHIHIDREEVSFANRFFARPLPEVLAFLRDVPFDLCSSSSICHGWGYSGSPLAYLPPGFADGHHRHGWMCAFKGDGHRRLVSRRWLDYGPWRVIRIEDADISFVQFHELGIPDADAMAQAKPAHWRMGSTANGGFIEARYRWKYKIGSSYEPVSRTLLQVVLGRDVDEEEMLDAAAIKLWQPLDKPVDQVAYVFPEEARARRHLHELWLRGLEVRAIVNGAERRLDLDYQPPAPVVPDWVTRVQDEEGR